MEKQKQSWIFKSVFMYYDYWVWNVQLNPNSVRMLTSFASSASNKLRMVSFLFFLSLSNKTYEGELEHLPTGYAPYRLSLPSVHPSSPCPYPSSYPLYVSDFAKGYGCCPLGSRTWYLHLPITRGSQQDSNYYVLTHIHLVNFAFILR